MIASLGMYDPPWLHEANDALWQAVARRLHEAGLERVPDALERDRPLDAIWRDGTLLLAQTCGYPLMTRFRDRLTLVGTPVYDLPGCDGTRHRSLVVVGEAAPFAALADLRGARAAVNGADSNTGMNLLRHAVAPLAANGRFFGAVTETGAHLASLDLLRTGRVDVAAIDCVTFGLAARHRPDLVAGLRVLAETAAGPALPFVTRRDAPPEEVALLRAALDAAAREAGAPLALQGVQPAMIDDYIRLLDYEAQAVAAGYPVLA